MTLRPGSLTFLIIAITAFGMAGVSYGQPAPKQVNVYIDSVMAADTNEGTDPRLAPMGQKLRGLFGFSTYSLIGHNEGQTDCGKMIAFTLPGGKILHVQPRAIDGDMIAMEIVLFDGTRPMMTTDLKLKNNGTLDRRRSALRAGDDDHFDWREHRRNSANAGSGHSSGRSDFSLELHSGSKYGATRPSKWNSRASAIHLRSTPCIGSGMRSSGKKPAASASSGFGFSSPPTIRQ